MSKLTPDPRQSIRRYSMSKAFHVLLGLAACTIIMPPASAGEQPAPGEFPRITFSGNIRARYEYLDNFTIRRYAVHEDDNILLSRLRLGADLLLRPNFRFYAELQDNRFFSEDFDVHDFPPACPYENRLDLRQGFMEAKHLWEGPWGFKIGRQAISYRDNRIWGPGDWGNTGRYLWDAAKLYYYSDAVSLDAIIAERVLPNSLKFDGNHYPFQAYGLYANLPQLKPLTLDLFYALRRDAHETTKGESGVGDAERHTIGVYVKGELPHGFDGSATAAWQLGDNGPDDVHAYAFVGELGCQIEEVLRPRPYVAVSYASGDSNPADGRCETFDGVFGAIDQYYGRMNLISWMNMIDYQCGVAIHPINKLTLSADYHRFMLAESKDSWYYSNGNSMRRDRTGAAGRNLGQEIDLIVKYDVPLGESRIAKAIRKLELMAGYGYFMPGSFIKRTGSADDAHWMFMQTALSF